LSLAGVVAAELARLSLVLELLPLLPPPRFPRFAACDAPVPPNATSTTADRDNHP